MVEGLKFLLNFSQKKNNFSEINKSVLINQKIVSYNFYQKVDSNSSKSIIIFSGFSVFGFKDERIRNLATAISNCGFNVFIPQINSIEKLEIKEDILEDIAAFIQYIASLKEFSPNGNVGVLAPSFSGGMLLNSIAKNKLESYISSICTIGTFANIKTTLTFILNNNQEDDYARNVLLKNFIDYSSIPNKENLKKLLTIAIQDNGFKRKKPLLKEALNNEEVDVQLQWFNLHQNIEYRKMLFDEIKKKSSIIEDLEISLNVVNHVNKFNIPIVLIHGKSDSVIPANESLQIHNIRQKNALPSRLCITDLLDHGDAALNFGKIKEIFQLANAFSYFFKYA